MQININHYSITLLFNSNSVSFSFFRASWSFIVIILVFHTCIFVFKWYKMRTVSVPRNAHTRIHHITQARRRIMQAVDKSSCFLFFLSLRWSSSLLFSLVFSLFFSLKTLPLFCLFCSLFSSSSFRNKINTLANRNRNFFFFLHLRVFAIPTRNSTI